MTPPEAVLTQLVIMTLLAAVAEAHHTLTVAVRALDRVEHCRDGGKGMGGGAWHTQTCARTQTHKHVHGDARTHTYTHTCAYIYHTHRHTCTPKVVDTNTYLVQPISL